MYSARTGGFGMFTMFTMSVRTSSKFMWEFVLRISFSRLSRYMLLMMVSTRGRRRGDWTLPFCWTCKREMGTSTIDLMRIMLTFWDFVQYLPPLMCLQLEINTHYLNLTRQLNLTLIFQNLSV